MGRLCSFVFAGIVLAVMFAGSGLAATAQLSQADLAALAKGEPFVRVTRVAPPSVLGAAGKTLAGIDIKAPPEAVFAVLRDCKRIMRVIKSMTSCTVRKSDPKGLWEERVTSSAPSAVLPTFKSVSRFDFAPFRQIKFRQLEGTMDYAFGQWDLVPASDRKTTRLYYQVSIGTSIPIPESLISTLISNDLPRTLKAFREEVLRGVPRP
ncbi:MAG TPA: hypothetical protein DCL48_10200 [Alphaproteobacteria bacterium]|nr:hypothetical protein [Alphaproteobacteria bacterium]